LTRKLPNFASLSEEDARALDAAGTREEHFDARQEIVHEGAVPHAAPVLHAGLARGYRIPGDGRRQITSFLIPGDICDPSPAGVPPKRPVQSGATHADPARLAASSANRGDQGEDHLHLRGQPEIVSGYFDRQEQLLCERQGG
jgi:hypothetical protein